MKLFKITIFIFFFLFPGLFAKSENHISPYFSGNLSISNSSVRENYKDQSFHAALGVGFGFPVYKSFSFYSRLTYTSRPGYTAYDYLTFIDNDISIINQLTAANVAFSQFIFNAGLQYGFQISNEIKFGLSGGFTYSLVNQRVSLKTGKMIENLDNEGLYGYFAGASLEKTFEDSHMSIFGEAQYNFIRKDLVYYRSNFGGVNFTIGGKYYFKN
jgi:hypothetical protein